MKALPYYGEYEAFIDSVTKLVHQELIPNVARWEAERFFPNDVFKLLGEQGYLGLLISEEYGGVGGDYKMAGAWCEAFGELASVGLTVGVNMHSLVISHALEKFGTETAKQHWLPKAVKGEAIGAYAFTEPGAGSDLASIRTTATKHGSRWKINGSKTFITNGARADFILVLTKTDPTAGYKGFTTFVVDTKSKGFKVSKTLHKLGWHASDTAELSFEDVEVDESRVLGKLGEGWGQAASNLNWERLMLTLTSLAGARMCLQASTRYASERKAFGRTIGEFGDIAEYLQEMERRIQLGEALAHRALDELCSSKDCRPLVAAAKRMVCDDAVWIADKAIQIHGGYGYTTEFLPERWWRDLRLMPIGGGTSEIMTNILRKELQKP
jgi:alkylation response protein AidB-like acyl-CoA dehydrogenase